MNGELVRTVNFKDGKYQILKYSFPNQDWYKVTYFKKFGDRYVPMAPMFEEAEFMTKEKAEEYLGVKLD